MMSAVIEPFFYCLLASLIWAPAVFIAAALLSRDDKDTHHPSALAGKVWPAALVIAALPVLLAPIAATLGLSLRAPTASPPMMEPAGLLMAPVDAAVVSTYDAPSTISLADLLRMTAVLYFYGFVMLFALAAVRHVWFAYRLNYAVKLDEPNLEAELEAWRTRIGVNRQPRYVFSHIVSSVCVYGFLRPVIVMPMNILDRVSIEDAALMGAHEMAHIKRGDVALFALCSVARAVFWFNPFMHQICVRATLTAEQGADALVLARGVNRRQYAHCFVQGLRLAANARYGFAGELIPSFTPFDKRSRRQRLDAILSGTPEHHALTLTSKLGLATGAVVAAGLAFAQAALAVSPPVIDDALPVRPVEGEVTLGYGERSKFLSGDRPAHEGIDLRAARGEPVRASGAGKIIAATDNYQGKRSWGNVVVIDHGHGLITRYAHLDTYAVERGEHVDAGQVIGAVGETGAATGPHLHFEVIAEGETIDPTPIATPAPVRDVRATMKRKVRLAPTPLASAAVAPINDSSHDRSGAASALSSDPDGRQKAKDAAQRTKLQKQIRALEKRLRKQFQDFDSFADLEGMTIELEGGRRWGTQDWAELFEQSRAELADLGEFAVIAPEISELVAREYFTEEDLDALRESQAEAMEDVAAAMANIHDRLTEQNEARKEASRAMRELAREEKERARELKREHKRQAAEREIMHREAEREMAEAEEAWANRYGEAMDERELLEQQEQELRNAKESLELQLAEIERRRKELSESE